MIWVKLFWWMLWRSVLSGAASGALYGTLLALILGAVFGFVFGAILGLVTGIANGIALVILTRRWVSKSQDSTRFRKAAVRLVVICTAITSFILMNLLFAGIGLFTVSPTMIATVVLGLIARRFPAYVENEFWEHEHPEVIPPRKAQIVW